MSTRLDSAPSPPITSKADLVAWIAKGEKPTDKWRIGTEHEKFLVLSDTHAPVPYESRRGVLALMQGLMQSYGWEPIREGDTIIALKRPDGQAGGTVSLEPGGQFELSGDPLSTLHEVAGETREHIDQVKAIGAKLGIKALGLGFAPEATRAQTPTMPKRRYAVMTRYMPKVGKLGLDMMYRTCTVQANLDFSSEADMVQKLRVSLALQPIATALFANSPFTEGKPNGFRSMRAEVWRDTDNARAGNLPFAFDDGMGYERYVDYALDVPMYFIYRDGHYIDVAGASFRDFMAGKLAQVLNRPELKGIVATMDDWADHVTTLFPDVRLKRFLEMRGADVGRTDHIVALPAFWVGLIYDQTALNAASDLVKDWTDEERTMLRDQVPKYALDVPFRKGTVLDVARTALDIARGGLVRRAKFTPLGQDESVYLDPLQRIVTSGKTAADDLLALYDGRWEGRIAPIYSECAF
jgi:glutamate--cysteine ligase